MQLVEACQEKEEGEMRELIGFMFFIGGLIWLALMWWPLWIVYMVIFGWSLLDD
jgi:dolichol kinase